MQCDPNCGACCGPVFCSPGEFGRVKVFIERNNITPVAQGITCPFYQGGTCAIYDARPFVCRMFGHCEGMVCCKGYNVNISQDHEDKLTREYRRRGGMTLQARCLHEFAYTVEQVTKILKEDLEDHGYDTTATDTGLVPSGSQASQHHNL